MVMLACNWTDEKIDRRYIVMPKFDGARAYVKDGLLRGRSNRYFANLKINERFSNRLFEGFDGELLCAEPSDSQLCNKTTSSINTIHGEAASTLWVFDYITDELKDQPYEYRLTKLWEYVRFLGLAHPEASQHISLMPYLGASTAKDILSIHEDHLARGFEGTILRDPLAKWEDKRSSLVTRSFLKIKNFADSDALVCSLTEGYKNNNVQTVNLLGRRERSSHKANLVPNGTLGAIVAKDLKTGRVLSIAPGTLTKEERQFYWDNPSKIIGQIIKYKYLDYGIKTMPRQLTFLSFRSKEDCDDNDVLYNPTQDKTMK